MTRVLILGGAGMLGHKLCQVLGPVFETYATFRSQPPGVVGVFDRTRTIAGVDANDFASVESAIRNVRPDCVINAIGLVKQRHESRDAIASISLNSLFPHRVARVCRADSARLVHFSTDCVFSGLKGAYTTEDIPDPVDLYGRSKLLGEVDDEQTVTIRTSIIGRELRAHLGLVEWFLSQAGGHVRGYAKAIYSGLTTEVFSEAIVRVIGIPSLHGIWHVSSEPISKFELLLLLNEAFGTSTTVERDEDFRCDRSLVSEPFWGITGLRRPTWPDMIRRLAGDPIPYAKEA